MELRQRNKGILLSTHLLDVIELFCDRYILIDNGSIVATGSKTEIAKCHGLSPQLTVEKIYIVLFSEMLTAVVLYLAQNFIMGNIFNIFILILQMKRFTSISFETFVSDMKYSYGAQAAVARKDFGLLLAYAMNSVISLI